MASWDEADEDVLTEATWFSYSDRVATPAIGQEDVPSRSAGRVDPEWFEGEGPSRRQPPPTDNDGDGWHTPHDSDYAQTIEVLQRVVVVFLGPCEISGDHKTLTCRARAR